MTQEAQATEVQAEVKPTLTYTEKRTNYYNTLLARINKDTIEANKVYAELQNIAAIEAITEGSLVVVKQGRKFQDKDTTRFENGTVVAVKDDDSGKKLFRVSIGSGFDADIVTVDVNALVTGTTAEEANAAYAAAQVVAQQPDAVDPVSAE